MALYHTHAEKLKPNVLSAKFTKEQLTTVLKMMENCSQLRQGSAIRSFFDCMLPDNFERREDTNNPITYTRNGIEKSFNPSIILEKGENLPEKKQDKDLEKIKEIGEI